MDSKIIEKALEPKTIFSIAALIIIITYCSFFLAQTGTKVEIGAIKISPATVQVIGE
jgi:preprotein translocase subunit Sec61beta